MGGLFDRRVVHRLFLCIEKLPFVGFEQGMMARLLHHEVSLDSGDLVDFVFTQTYLGVVRGEVVEKVRVYLNETCEVRDLSELGSKIFHAGQPIRVANGRYDNDVEVVVEERP